MKTIFTMLAEFLALVGMFAVFYVLLLMAPGIEQSIIDWKQS
jgi:hypothetical protein